jgi:hypothetical protein
MAFLDNYNILVIIIAQQRLCHLLTFVRNIVQRKEALARCFGELRQEASQDTGNGHALTLGSANIRFRHSPELPDAFCLPGLAAFFRLVDECGGCRDRHLP